MIFDFSKRIPFGSRASSALTARGGTTTAMRAVGAVSRDLAARLVMSVM